MKPKNFPGRVKVRRERALEARGEDVERYSKVIEDSSTDLAEYNAMKNLTELDKLAKEDVQFSLNEASTKLEIAKKEKAILEDRV